MHLHLLMLWILIEVPNSEPADLVKPSDHLRRFFARFEVTFPLIFEQIIALEHGFEDIVIFCIALLQQVFLHHGQLTFVYA